MTGPTASMLPPDAMERAEAKGTDHYANLSAEERAEEGLPPAEPATTTPASAPAAAPAAEPTTAPTPETKPDGDAGDDDDTGEQVEQLFRDIAEIKEQLGASLGKTETAPKGKKAEDEFLEAALEHADPVVRGLAEQLQKAQSDMKALQDSAKEERFNRQLEKDNAEFEAVQAGYEIGGKPLTDAHLDKVAKYMVAHPAVARELTIEQVTRLVLPNAVKAEKAPPAKGTGAPSGEGAPVATIVTDGAAGGAPTGKWQPRAGETMESAVAEAGRRLFGVNR